jgi:hypothetical protein
VLSDKEDDRRDVEITRPLRDGREWDSCGALSFKVRCEERKASQGKYTVPKRERQKIIPMTTSLVDDSVVLFY